MSDVHLFMATVLMFISGLGFFIWRMLRELHLTMNSRLDELLQATNKLARAEGFKAGQEDHLDDIRRASEMTERSP